MLVLSYVSFLGELYFFFNPKFGYQNTTNELTDLDVTGTAVVASVS